jgi:enoyl-CoA hydratase/carnithine racemase
VDAGEADRLGLLARVAPAAQAEAAAIELARQVAAAPAEGLRRLKELFREYDGSRSRVERENTEIVEFQRTGAGVPYGGIRGR